MKKIRLPYFLDSKIRKRFSELYSEFLIQVHDKNGNLIRENKQVCYSYNENFLSMIYSLYANLGGDLVNYGFTAPHTSPNSVFSIANIETTVNAAILASTGPSTNALNGLVVGTGVVAPTPAARALTAKINNGIAAGQLVYSQQQCVSGVTVLGNVSTMTLFRTFLNSSPGAITVTEVGLYSSLSPTHYMLLFDLLAPSQNIGVGQTLTLQLSTQITT